MSLAMEAAEQKPVGDYDVARLFDFPEIGNVSPSESIVREAIYNAYNCRDFWTHAPLRLSNMVIDHVLPRSMHGPDNVFNLVPTTKYTNSVKGEKYDRIAIAGVLGIIRLHYGHRVLMAINLAADQQLWWRMDPDLIARESREKIQITDGLHRYLEENRRRFAEILGGIVNLSWRDFSNVLYEADVRGPGVLGGPREKYGPNRVQAAWLKVIRTDRSS